MPKTLPLIDNRNTILEIGQTVAYNLSGEIAVGEILSLKPAIVRDNGWEYITKETIKIKQQHPKNMVGKISTVKCSKNVMVIHEDA